MPMLSIEHTQALMMLAGVALLCWMLIRKRMRRKLTHSGSAPIATGSVGLKYNSQAVVKPNNYSGLGSVSAPADALQWQLDLHDLGRELKAELDCKLIAVREMTQAYDRASRRLLALIHAAERSALSQPGVLQSIRELQGEGMSPALIAKQLNLSETDVAELSQLSDIQTCSE